jgi:hypothetical protein
MGEGEMIEEGDIERGRERERRDEQEGDIERGRERGRRGTQGEMGRM